MNELRRSGKERERVYREIRQALMAGVFEPGQKIIVASLASALGVSAMPVRDALRGLAAERALEMEPNRSVRVPRLSRTELRQVRNLRELVEGYAAAEACSRIGASEIAELEQYLVAFAGARDRRDGKAILRINESFHFTVYKAARIPVLCDVISMLWLRSAPTMNVMFMTRFINRYPAFPQTKNNRDLVSALKARDAEAASAAVRREIAEGTRIIDKILEEIGWEETDDMNEPDRSSSADEVARIGRMA